MPEAKLRAQFDAVTVGRRVLAVEADALLQMSASLDGPFAAVVDCIAAAEGRVVCTGVGKSGHVARKIAATMASTGQPALFVHATEASHGDLGMIGAGDVVLALSKTGETKELADVIAYAKRYAIPLIALTAEADSALGRAADHLLLIPNAQEAAHTLNAPTTSTTLQMAMGDAVAVALLERRGFTPQDFKVFHPGGKLGAALITVTDVMHGCDQTPLVGEKAMMREVLDEISARAMGCVGVVDEAGKLVGVITDGDVRRHVDGLLERCAGEVMTRAPKVAPPDMLAGEALNKMEGKITALFVVEDGRPIGIVHVHDLLRRGVM
jgi:arabinose-5-phosphate isomerase